ncbi:hypothetical protein AB4Z34_07440 [Ensifer sp. 2YAB10]|uniref:hypothetical protein n=1 Tax=Ensifer sp. 2YAB10 TaxID=3233021 RepID=UPI003F91C0D8
MLRTSCLVAKKMDSLEPGELLRMTFGTSAGIVLFLRRYDYNSGLFGVLEAEEFTNHMIWYSGSLNEECLSYGRDWVLEEVHGKETACRLQHRHDGARLFLGKTGPIMCFAPPQGGGSYQVRYFDVAGEKECESLGREAAPIHAWRIWESKAHFDRGGQPLLEMGGATQ